jgi:hypothetical protein
VAASALLACHQNQTRYDLIHVHNITAFLLFSAWYPKLTGAKLILDLSDIGPELCEREFPNRRGRLYGKLHALIEKLLARSADHVIFEEYVDRHSWAEKRREYLELVDSLLTEEFSELTSKSCPLPNQGDL